MSLKTFIPDERRAKVWREIPLPLDRPPTRQEVWSHYHGIFFDWKGHKPAPICTEKCNHRNHGELEGYCRDAWAWAYIAAVLKGWDKHLEWKEGDPVIPAGVGKTTDFEAGNWSKNLAVIYQLHQNVLQTRQEAA